MAGLFPHRTVLAPWEGPGRVVTVWGPTGSPGRSTLAAGLAGALAQAGRVVLVDADRSRGALGTLLGVTGGGNIVEAATVPPPQGAPCRPRDLHAHRAGFTLIRGVPGPAQETPLDADDLATLLARLHYHFDLVLVDVGAALPPREFGDVHLAALRAADLVLVVAALTPLGLSDLLLQFRVLVERLDPPIIRAVGDGQVSLDSGSAGPPTWCVLNRGRGGLLRHGASRVIAETGLPVVATIPLDTRNVVVAEEARLPLTVARPRSPAATLIAGLAARMWQVPARHSCLPVDSSGVAPVLPASEAMGTFFGQSGRALAVRNPRSGESQDVATARARRSGDYQDNSSPRSRSSGDYQDNSSRPSHSSGESQEVPSPRNRPSGDFQDIGRV